MILFPGSKNTLCEIGSVIFAAYSGIHALAVGFCNFIVVHGHISPVLETLPPNGGDKVKLRIFKTQVWILKMHTVATHILFQCCLMNLFLYLHGIFHRYTILQGAVR